MDDARALLDSLMGPSRNQEVKEERKGGEPDFTDRKICRNFLVGFCPHDWFTVNKRQLEPCTKFHSEYMKGQYEAHPEKEKYQREYEAEFLAYLEKVVADCDTYIARERARCRQKGAGGKQVRLPPADKEKVDELEVRYAIRLKEAEDMAEESVARSGELTEQAVALREQVDALKARHTHEFPGEEVCEICGVRYALTGGGLSEFHGKGSHLNGRTHEGYAEIRAKVAELREQKRQWERDRGKDKERERGRRRDDDRREKAEKDKEKEKEARSDEEGGKETTQNGDCKERERGRRRDDDRREKAEKEKDKEKEKEKKARSDEEGGKDRTPNGDSKAEKEKERRVRSRSKKSRFGRQSKGKSSERGRSRSRDRGKAAKGKDPPKRRRNSSSSQSHGKGRTGRAKEKERNSHSNKDKEKEKKEKKKARSSSSSRKRGASKSKARKKAKSREKGSSKKNSKSQKRKKKRSPSDSSS